MAKYDEEDIDNVKAVVEEMICVFKDEGFRLKILEDLKMYHAMKGFEDNFQNAIKNFIIYNFELKLKQKKSYVINYLEYEVKGGQTNEITNGLGTFLTFFVALFLYSKGLKRKNMKITNKLFLMLPYSSFENLEENEVILGYKKNFSIFKFNDSYLNNKPPFLNNAMFILGQSKDQKESGGVGCPYVRGKGSKEINDDLVKAFLDLMEYINKHFLEPNITEFENSKKAPVFVNILLGRFEINEKHLKSYPQFFQRI